MHGSSMNDLGSMFTEPAPSLFASNDFVQWPLFSSTLTSSVTISKSTKEATSSPFFTIIIVHKMTDHDTQQALLRVTHKPNKILISTPSANKKFLARPHGVRSSILELTVFEWTSITRRRQQQTLHALPVPNRLLISIPALQGADNILKLFNQATTITTIALDIGILKPPSSLTASIATS